MTMSMVNVLFLMTVSLSLMKSCSRVLPLDMADNSVDDSYEGCRDDRDKLVKSKYLEEEKNKNSDFKTAWENALQQCKGRKSGLTKDHCAAIYMYTGNTYVKFNEATCTGAAAYKSGAFQFYSLHFFLTDAVQKLKLKQTECVTSYRRTNVTFVKDVINKTIRFGSFASSSSDQNLVKFGKESCFQIYTCFGAKVAIYSKHQDEHEVLIPPYETFTVTAIKTIDKEKDLWCKVVYEVKSAGKMSNLQCYKIKSRS